MEPTSKRVFILMKTFFISILLYILCVNAFCGEPEAAEIEMISGINCKQFFDATDTRSNSELFWESTSDFCSLSGMEEQIQPSSLDKVYSMFESIGNDLAVGFGYGLILPATVGIIVVPVVIIFSRYVSNPYDRDMPNLLTILSLSEEQCLIIIRNLRFPDYNLIVKGSIAEEIIFRFIGLTAVKSHMNYLLEKLEYDGQELKNKSEIFSVIISSIVFGLSHLLNPNPQLAQAISATFGGLFFGYIYCGNGIISPITAHMVNNLLAVTIIKLLRWQLLRFST